MVRKGERGKRGGEGRTLVFVEFDLGIGGGHDGTLGAELAHETGLGNGQRLLLHRLVNGRLKNATSANAHTTSQHTQHVTTHNTGRQGGTSSCLRMELNSSIQHTPPSASTSAPASSI